MGSVGRPHLFDQLTISCQPLFYARYLAVYQGYLDVLKLMIGNGGDIHKLNKNHKSLLDMALDNEQWASVKFLEIIED